MKSSLREKAMKRAAKRIKNAMLKYFADYLKRAQESLSKPDYKPLKP